MYPRNEMPRYLLSLFLALCLAEHASAQAPVKFLGVRALAPPRADGDGDANSTWPRFAAFEDDVALLPQHAFIYDAVDLLILTTDNAKFLTALQADAARIKALSQWVQRGGRLIISV